MTKWPHTHGKPQVLSSEQTGTTRQNQPKAPGTVCELSAWLLGKAPGMPVRPGKSRTPGRNRMIGKEATPSQLQYLLIGLFENEDKWAYCSPNPRNFQRVIIVSGEVTFVTATSLRFCFDGYSFDLFQVNRLEMQNYVVLGIKEREAFTAEGISHGASQRIKEALFLFHPRDTCHPGRCHWFET
jgi:hypothetical protein